MERQDLNPSSESMFLATVLIVQELFHHLGECEQISLKG